MFSYMTLYIHMQEEINKLLTSEIATTVRKNKLLNICAKKEKPIYHNASENFSIKRKQIFRPLVHDSTSAQLGQLGPLNL